MKSLPFRYKPAAQASEPAFPGKCSLASASGLYLCNFKTCAAGLYFVLSRENVAVQLGFGNSLERFQQEAPKFLDAADLYAFIRGMGTRNSGAETDHLHFRIVVANNPAFQSCMTGGNMCRVSKHLLVQ